MVKTDRIYITQDNQPTGSYFDRLTVEEINQQSDAQIVDVCGEVEEKVIQQRQESLRFIPRKQKSIRANETWTSARKEARRSKINAVNIITVQPHFFWTRYYCVWVSKEAGQQPHNFGNDKHS
jgi:hypothetical protein